MVAQKRICILLSMSNSKKDIFISLNYKKINKKFIIKKILYEHPVFTKPLDQIETLSNKAQGINNVWMAGAWLGYGFHEDGVKSALKIKKMINVK